MKARATSALQAGLRLLPSVDELVRSQSGRRIVGEAGSKRLSELSRLVITEIRNELTANHSSHSRTKQEIFAEAEARLKERWQLSLSTGMSRVINASGVVLHTNLGRAPLSEAAKQKLLEATGYCNLEYDLETGLRGKRGGRVETLLCELTGAE